MIVIGEGILDLYLDLEMAKLGGVFHYAHVLESLKIKSKVFHITPDYLHIHLQKLSYKYAEFIDIGKITNSPNIITIAESKETGDQKYKNVLDKLKEIYFIENELEKLTIDTDEHLFILPGSYNIKALVRVLEKFQGKVYIDIAYDINREILEDLNYRFSIIFISTSSEFFLKQFAGDIYNLKSWIIPKFADTLILKENRGGSRIFTQKETFRIPAHIANVVHSVGLGDCYNIALISNLANSNFILAGRYASKVASIYGQCATLDEFKSRINNLTVDDYRIEGVSLPWEERKKSSIYIAAPDFKGSDTSIIDNICEKLEYHNFKPIRPVQVSGEIGSKTSQSQIRRIIKNDINLINDAKLIVAIIIYKDEGTIAEIGYAAALGKPVIVYDPFKLIHNAFVENISKKITYSPEDLINSIFLLMNSNEN